MLQQTISLCPFMRQFIVLPEIATRTRQHKIAWIIGSASCQRHNMVNMIRPFSAIKLLSAIVTSSTLTLELVGNILSGKFAACPHFERSAPIMFSSVYMLAVFSSIVSSFAFSKDIPMFTAVSAYDIPAPDIFLFMILAQLVFVSAPVLFLIGNSLLSVGSIVKPISFKGFLFVPYAVLLHLAKICFSISPVRFSLFLQDFFFVVLPVPLCFCEYLLSIGFVCLLLLFANLLSVSALILSALLIQRFFISLIALFALFSMGIIVCLALSFHANLTCRPKPIFLDLCSGEKLRSAWKNLLAFGTLLQCMRCLIHKPNYLSFSLPCFFVARMQGGIFSHPMISQELGNALIIHSFSLNAMWKGIAS